MQTSIYKKNSENSQLSSFEKSRTLDTYILQDKQNEWSQCSILTGGSIVGIFLSFMKSFSAGQGLIIFTKCNSL